MQASDEEMPRMVALVNAHPAATLPELAVLANKKFGRKRPSSDVND
ncbi:hypothetical protein [Myxococcus xanthus]|uniref:Uncharacterized protein n=1 Tax=Myxococcus xanthus TaxID=34 RepID=A0A7Y4IJF4_MYXXA|nr:hypothetical protein [Myxococcus xanthus]NOJ80401.1 hypothetical protein [Myxococcus xanthus]NOJ84934.1 hypothetical protein [Myxococcus xanthus]